MDTDLHRVIQSSQPLSDAHVKFFLHQLLRGVKYLHDNGVLHRDLKPGNLLLTKSCQLKIADFGLARKLPKSYGIQAGSTTNGLERPKSAPATSSSTAPRIERAPMTEHVVTRWYRAPELMLQPDGLYDRSVDMWSVGCIFAEILGRKALFPGKNFMHQLSLIFDVIGTPPSDAASRIKSAQAQKFLRSLGKRPKVPFKSMFPAASDPAIDLLDRLLEFDPQKRISADEALAHPYLIDVEKKYKGGADPNPSLRIDFSFDSKNLNKLDLRAMIIKEVDRIRKLQSPGAVDGDTTLEEGIPASTVSMESTPQTLCGAAGSSLIRTSSTRATPPHPNHSEIAHPSAPAAPPPALIHSQASPPQHPNAVILGSRRHRIRTLSKPPVPRRHNSVSVVSSTNTQGTIRLESATATQQLMGLNEPEQSDQVLVASASTVAEVKNEGSADSPTVRDQSPRSPRSPERTDNNHEEEDIRAPKTPPKAVVTTYSRLDEALPANLSKPVQSSTIQPTAFVAPVVQSTSSTAEAIAAAIALGERSKTLIASLAASRSTCDSVTSTHRRRDSTSKRNYNPAESPPSDRQNEAAFSSSSSSEVSPSVPDSPPTSSLEHFKGAAVPTAPTIPRRRISSAGPIRSRTNQIEQSRVGVKDGTFVGSTSSLIRAQRAGGGQTLTESANRTIAAMTSSTASADHHRHHSEAVHQNIEDNDDRIERQSSPRGEIKTGLLKSQRSASQLHGVEHQNNGRKVPPKRLTVPRSPKFSVMSWQKKRDGNANAPLAAAVAATGRR